MQQWDFLATCPKGLGVLLQREVTDLGGEAVRETPAGVHFQGSLAVAYRVCLWSRLANRVLVTLSQTAVASAEDLYQSALGVSWPDQFASSARFVVDFSGRSDAIRNTQFGAQRVKDGVVDAFQSRGLARPNVDTKEPDIRINARLHKGKLTLALDLSGGSLHRRGYRTESGKAPVKENMAAAVLLQAGWPEMAERGLPLIDPMCGSGTLLIEAAFMALDRAPALERPYFGFMAWLHHNPPQWAAMLADAKARYRARVPEGLEIRGYDADVVAVRRARESIRLLGLDDIVRIEVGSLHELVRPTHRAMPEGLLVVNPPWGERLGQESSVAYLYRELGQRLHAHFQGWSAAVLTSDKALGRAIGLRSHKHYAFNNGAVDVLTLLFSLDPSNQLKVTSPWASATRGAEGHKPPEPQSVKTFEELSPGAQMFANRLRKNVKRLQSWVKRTGVTCYRLYDADMPEYAVAIDTYEGRLHVAEYAPPKSIDPASAQQRLEEVLAALPCALNVSPAAVVGVKRRQRQQGNQQYGRMGEQGERFQVREGAAKVLVNLTDYLDTGLFLDHRPLRTKLFQEAKGKHFLNLFCYTGVATVQAALGGAHTSTSVDLSNTYLSWFKDNLALNGLSERQHRAERSDVLTWLSTCTRQYDLILLDPPSFSNSKATTQTFDVQRDHVPLVEGAMKVLAPGGRLYFSNNLKKFLLDASLESRYRVRNITQETVPEDFARHPDIHQCWSLEHP